MTTRPTLAITGGTGFVGSHVLDQALAAGHSLRALTRKPQPDRAGVTWVIGTLETAGSLEHLCAGADAVIHSAGAVNVPTRAAFAAANIAGTSAIVDAATQAGVTRFLHVSSLAAREPQLSNYGWSKAEAERVVEGSGLDWAIIRPPAIYGPRDADILDVFRMARSGIMLLPPAGRTSLIHVADLARLLVALAAGTQPLAHALYEVADDTAGGLSHQAMAQLIAQAVARPNAWRITAPAPLVRLAARGDRLVRGSRARLTPDRASYMCHADWVADPAKAPPVHLWQPHIPAAEGLAATAQWYRENGWLK